LDESKADKPTLEPILSYFMAWMSRRRSTYPELFSQPNESKRAEKTLELAIHRDKSKIVVNTHELVLSRTIRTRVEIKSIQDLNRARKCERSLSSSKLPRI
jgi:hypothetical protein